MVGVPDPPPDIALPVEILVDILGPLRGGGVDLYPNLPGKKVRNAMSRFGIRPDEQLVLLYDSNLLSKSMKNGMAFGLRGIYFDRGEYFTTDGPNCLPYGTFPACRFRPKPYSRIEFRSGMSYQFLNQLAMMRALNAIKECVMRGL